ncbi:GPW/gp25 family protein [Novosphingobium profundi]|uniref:GPW/gp25 family protein n=1 Tax=Novosphingobium profundi TaxID=1774954 RepID=UPI001CFC9B41|nr:GPW/gp25 family protein [Novosphingobium profundi]
MTRLAFPYGFDAEGRSRTLAYASDAHLRDMLELLILTRLGERVMRPELGSPVLQMVFGAGEGPAALALQASLEATIAQELGHLLKLHDLTTQFLDDEGVLEIVVHFEARARPQVSRLVVHADLP